MTTDLTVFDFRGGLSGSMMYSKNQDQQKITKMTKKQNGEKKKRVFRNNSKSKEKNYTFKIKLNKNKWKAVKSKE